jgi:hypothetical protein
MQQQSRLLYTERVLDDSQQDTGVRVLHLNNPNSLNSLTNDMAAEFTAELQQLKADSAMRALIVTGQVGCCNASAASTCCCSLRYWEECMLLASAAVMPAWPPFARCTVAAFIPATTAESDSDLQVPAHHYSELFQLQHLHVTFRCCFSAAVQGRAFSAGGDFSFIEERMAASVQDNEQASSVPVAEAAHHMNG